MSRKMQRSIDRSIWRYFCRISSSCDFCRRICLLVFTVLYKRISFICLVSHKSLSIFKLGIIVFWTGTQWFWTKTCNKITALSLTITSIEVIQSLLKKSIPPIVWISVTEWKKNGNLSCCRMYIIITSGRPLNGHCYEETVLLITDLTKHCIWSFCSYKTIPVSCQL